MTANSKKVIYIPDMMSAWLWARQINLFYKEVEAKSIVWLMSFRPYHTPESQIMHNKGNIGRLAALAYGDAPPDHLCITVNLVHLLYVLNKYTDIELIAGVQEISAIILNALHDTNKPCPAGELIVGKITRDFWAHGRAIATPQAEKCFLETMAEYLQRVAQQADNHDKLAIRNVHSYMATRREDSGVHACFMPGELHLSIPDEAFYHLVMKELQNTSIDLVVLNNRIAGGIKNLGGQR